MPRYVYLQKLGVPVKIKQGRPIYNEPQYKVRKSNILPVPLPLTRKEELNRLAETYG